MSLHEEIEQGASNSRPWLFIVAAIVAAAAFIYVTVNSFDQQIFYFTVAEAVAAEDDSLNDTFRLKGNVEPGSHVVREGTLDEHRFVLAEKGSEMSVNYKGPLPDTFQDEAEVVALGQVNADGVFVAEEITAKCPSRYEGEAPTADETM